MAAAVTEVEVMDPSSLEEARRRSDWKRWEEAIDVELKALKDAGTLGVVERPRGRNVVDSKCSILRKTPAAKSSATKPDSLQRVSHKFKA